MMNLRVTKADPSSGFLILDPDEQGCPGLRVEGLADNVVSTLELLGTLEPNLGEREPVDSDRLPNLSGRDLRLDDDGCLSQVSP